MIRFEERGFGDDERRSLSAELEELRAVRRRFGRFVLVSVVLILVVGVPLALGQWRKEPGLGMLAFGTVGVYALIVLYVYAREAGVHRDRVRTLAGVMSGEGVVRVTRCRSRRVVAFEEMEDEGPGYLFEIEPSEVYYVGGQQFYLDDAFPNEAFDIIEGFDGRGRPVLFEVRCLGEPLLPERTISAAVKLEMLERDVHPEDGDRIPCSLDDVERFLLGREAS